MLLCPVCHEPLVDDERGAACAGGHRFDRAREGYLYLLRSSKSGDSMGDPKSRRAPSRAFLNRGYYAPLRDAMVELVREQVSWARGVYGHSYDLARYLLRRGLLHQCQGAVSGVVLTAFDLGKEMVRLAAKRGDATYFVANMKDIPVADGAFDMVTELFAPFNEREFARVLAPEGSLYTVVPGARHLFGLKEVLYDTPYLNDEKLPKTTELKLVGTQRVSANITLQTQADIEAVFQMTPYYYRTRPADKERLANLDTLETDIDFIIAEYRHS